VSVQFGIITSVVPPGSWHYPQAIPGGKSIRITGFSFEQLVENILEFRRRHIELCGAENAYVEVVRSDLKKYLCANFAQNCADSRSTPHGATGISVINQEYYRPIDRAANWLAEVGKTKQEFVDLALAGERAHICAQCPQNIRWQSPCAPCNDNVLIRSQNLKGNLRTPYDRHLFVCRVFGHVNEVAVWMKDTQSSPLHPPPAFCWHNPKGS
jgi:hypothetical protein